MMMMPFNCSYRNKNETVKKKKLGQVYLTKLLIPDKNVRIGKRCFIKCHPTSRPCCGLLSLHAFCDPQHAPQYITLPFVTWQAHTLQGCTRAAQLTSFPLPTRLLPSLAPAAVADLQGWATIPGAAWGWATMPWVSQSA